MSFNELPSSKRIIALELALKNTHILHTCLFEFHLALSCPCPTVLSAVAKLSFCLQTFETQNKKLRSTCSLVHSAYSLSQSLLSLSHSFLFSLSLSFCLALLSAFRSLFTTALAMALCLAWPELLPCFGRFVVAQMFSHFFWLESRPSLVGHFVLEWTLNRGRLKALCEYCFCFFYYILLLLSFLLLLFVGSVLFGVCSFWI